MYKIVGIAASAMMLGLAGAAIAEPIEGVVQSIEAESNLIVLADGTSYKVQEGIDTSRLQRGMSVMLNVESAGSTEVVDAIRIQ